MAPMFMSMEAAGKCMSLVEAFKEKMASDMVARGNAGNDVWPAPRVDLDAAVLAIASNVISTLSESFGVLDSEESARCLRFPSGLAELMYLFMDRPRDAIDAQERARVAESMLDVLSVLRNGNAFCENGANNVSTTSVDTQVQMLTRNQAILLGRLIAYLNLYCEFCYFAFVAFGREVHGPYDPMIGATRLVRNYFDLHPNFWRFPEVLGFQTLEIVAEYVDIDPSFDFMGRLRVHASLPEQCVAAQLVVDGAKVPCSDHSLERLIESVDGALRAAREETLSNDEWALFEQLEKAVYWFGRHLFESASRRTRRPLQRANPGLRTYKALVDDGHSQLSITLRRLSKLDGEERLQGLRRLLDPAEIDKYV